MDEWVWSNGGMILTGENWSTGRKTLYSVGGRWMNEYGAMVEWYWQGKTEVLGEEHYTAWVVDEWMSMEQWWNDTDREHWITRSNTVHSTLCPPETSHGGEWDGKRVSRVSGRQKTTRATTRHFSNKEHMKEIIITLCFDGNRDAFPDGKSGRGQ